MKNLTAPGMKSEESFDVRFTNCDLTNRRFLILHLTLFLISIASYGQPASERFFETEARLSKEQLCDTLLRQAAASLEKRQWDYAVEKYGRVLELDDKNLAARYFRAYAHTRLRQYDWAKSDYEDFLRLVPRHFEAELGLAYVYEKLGKRRDALDAYNRIVQHFPDSASAYAARAVYEQANDLAEVALYDWERAINLAPSNADYMISRVDLLITLGRRDEARKALDAMRRQGIAEGSLREWYRKLKP